jgi:hypothetical protein
VGVTLTGFTSSVSCAFSDNVDGVWYTQTLPAGFNGQTNAYFGWPGRQLMVTCGGVSGSIIW